MTDDKSTSNTQNKSSIKTSKLAKSVALDVSASASSDKTQTNEPSSTKDTITQKKEKQTFRQPTKNTEKHSVAVNNKISKVAVVALMLVILVIVAMFSAFFYYQQQHSQLKSELNNAIEQQKIAGQNQWHQQLSAHQNSINSKLTQQLSTLEKSNLSSILQLEKRINQQIEARPTDWLINEAEYLIRMASRSLWLHKDIASAVKLLKAADQYVKQTDQSKYFELRQFITDDITRLNSIPALAIEDTVLSLMALNKQIATLPLAHVKKESVPIEKKQLSGDIADWRANLLITWNKFIADYFTLRPINAKIQPLLTPDYQQNLRQNLSLKVQLAIWAATEHKSVLFKHTLTDINDWLTQYFDMEQTTNIVFLDTIKRINTNIIDVDYAIELSSLLALKEEIKQQLIDSSDTVVPPQPNLSDKDNNTKPKPDSLNGEQTLIKGKEST
jgi:uroporphyrin-3 C-methyltransferase